MRKCAYHVVLEHGLDVEVKVCVGAWYGSIAIDRAGHFAVEVGVGCDSDEWMSAIDVTVYEHDYKQEGNTVKEIQGSAVDGYLLADKLDGSINKQEHNSERGFVACKPGNNKHEPGEEVIFLLMKAFSVKEEKNRKRKDKRKRDVLSNSDCVFGHKRPYGYKEGTDESGFIVIKVTHYVECDYDQSDE